VFIIAAVVVRTTWKCYARQPTVISLQLSVGFFTELARTVRRASTRQVIAVTLAACSAALLAGLTLKYCPVPPKRHISLLCFSDLKLFYESRGIAQMPFPYVHGGIQGTQLLPGSLEYPVMTGIFIWLMVKPAWSPNSYLVISAMVLGPLALLVSYLLARMSRWRALLYAAAPALALYAFQNWDLLAVAPTVVGLWCWSRDRPVWAAFFFGVGACTKMYPAIFVAPLVFEALFLADPRAAAVRLIAGAGTAALINLPFAVVNFPGWFATYQFHRLRPPNIDSMWGLKFSSSFAGTAWSTDTLNQLTSVLMIASFLLVFFFGWRRAVRDHRYPVIEVSAAALAVFMLWNKVHSPQYTLWILPFFALLRLNALWWAAYTLFDATVYLTVFYLGRVSLDLASPFLQIGVFGRAALLAVLVVRFLYSQSVVNPGSGEVATSLDRLLARNASKVFGS
jgi:uncharacterized membrane protein